MSSETFDFLDHGATWVRADFHLHTKQDKQFKASENESAYYTNYVGALGKAGIKIGVITNHNKFNYHEFKELNKEAKKKGMYLLPGVELSVSEGAGGVHILIVFHETWIESGDHINPFLQRMFQGKLSSQYESEDGRSDKNIVQVVDILNSYQKEYFLAFAHVECSRGLWNELGNGRLSDWKSASYAKVRERTLGFQKVRSRDRKKEIQQLLDPWYPAEIEGSDPKSLEEIGRGEKCYIKIGYCSYDAVKFALSNSTYINRVSSEIPRLEHSYIESVEFEGGIFSGQHLKLSPGLNTLIGIRGSGKSSIIELIRFALGIEFSDKTLDKTYKDSLVKYALGSGGKVTVHAVDRYGQHYEIRRISTERYPTVYLDGKSQPGVSVRETVLYKPLYFGQKDLSSTGEGFEKDLIEKLLGSQLNGIRTKIEQKKGEVLDQLALLEKLSNVQDQIADFSNQKRDAEFNLEIYKKYGLEQKLEKQLSFANDEYAMNSRIALVDSLLTNVSDLIIQNENEINNFAPYASTYNQDILDDFNAMYASVLSIFSDVKAQENSLTLSVQKLKEKRNELKERKNSLVEEFAAIERTLAEQLKEEKNISPESFRKLKQKASRATLMLKELEKADKKKVEVELNLERLLVELNSLWHEEFTLIQKELEHINESDSSLKVSIEFKADKEAFLEYMKSVFKGSKIRESSFKLLVDDYPDFISMYQEIDKVMGYVSQGPQFRILFESNLKAILTYQVPNKVSIMYRDKILQQHSLGQRASALILFVLSQRDNDVIIIDQPEDDLDNQTIYNDVIKLLVTLKSNIQFILATHNPNIPVLGDSEQVMACSLSKDMVSIETGGIDVPIVQNTIVDIMEGGDEAFRRRKEIYTIWKPSNY